MRFAVVLALAAALAVAATGYGRGADRGVPAGFHPETGAAVGQHDVWILGWYRCKLTKPCQALVRSTDGGRHYSRVAMPPISSLNTGRLEFVSPRVGYAFEMGSRLYVTHDGGSSWSPRSPAGVSGVAVGGGDIYAAFVGKRFARTPVSGSSWHAVKLPVRFRFLASLTAQGRKVWLMGSTRHIRSGDATLRSTDRGSTFKKSRTPCVPELAGELVPAGAGVVWAVCPSGMMAGILLSTNGGRTFPRYRSFHDPGGTSLPILTNGAAIFPSSPRDAVVYRGARGPLYRTTDMGRHWLSVRGTGRFEQLAWLSLATSEIGVGLFTTKSHPNQASLWRTTDRGATWHSMPIR